MAGRITVPVIAPNAAGRWAIRWETPLPNTTIRVQGGVPISNMFRKLIFAIYFGEKDIFFTTQNQ